MHVVLKLHFQTIADAQANAEYKSLVASVSTKSSLYCANGPYYKCYYVPGYLYWPPIRYRRCDGLACSHPGTCAATDSRVLYRWAIVFRCKYFCYFVGIRYVKFIDHRHCQCRECISNVNCQHPKTCNRYTYKCECLTTGICQHGYVWDRIQCKCIQCVRRTCSSGYFFDYGVCGCVWIKP